MKAGWIYKIILVGSHGTGKSSFIKNNNSNNAYNERYLEDYSKTIGTNFYIKKIPVTKKRFCQLQFWDLNTNEHFYFVLPSFFRGSSAFLLFFDSSDYSSFSDLELWIEIIHSYSEEIPIFLIGTKIDLNPEVPLREILDLVQAHNLLGPFFTSTKEKSQSSVIFNYIAENLTGNSILSEENHVLNEMQEQYELNFGMRGHSSDENRYRYESHNSLILLREIMEGNFTSPKDIERDLSPEEQEQLDLFLDYFKYCPICHQENHKKYLRKFFLSNDPFKQKLRDTVLELMENSEGYWDDRIYYNKLTIGIPCCTCFNKIFKK
ncbi:MAG: hypothetical protein EU541_08630 [Promethearchaeota archaeon]|nr:MAG: hypothetical protein EU541_08630 [Candidatus Lokiarchaeota archaeon]